MSFWQNIPGIKGRDDSPEGHFRLVVYLTVFFFIVTIGIEMINASQVWTVNVDPAVAKEAFHDFFLVAIGMARAASVIGDKSNGSGDNRNEGG